ncbi:uncharacterized protein [Macrobrachium rosenbergii]|uniref:uncharacterized protein n=1 Tax=Macrobrachium rosenbergii TaxID=79674 RepID=UPI0034D455B7
MKATAFLLALVCCVALCQAQRRDPLVDFLERLASGNRNVLTELDSIFQPNNVGNVVSCVIDLRSGSNCDPRAGAIRNVIPHLYRLGLRCPECNQQTQIAIERFVRGIRSDPQQCLRLEQAMRLPRLCGL